MENVAVEPDGRGIFSSPANQGITLRSKKRRAEARTRRQLNQFADALADGLDVTEAAAAAGANRAQGIGMLLRIKRQLGWQAR